MRGRDAGRGEEAGGRGPDRAELDKARNYLKGQFPLGLQSPDDLAAEIVNAEFFGLPQDFIASYPDKIGAVTMDDVKRVLKTYFCTDDLKILVVTNGDWRRRRSTAWVRSR